MHRFTPPGGLRGHRQLPQASPEPFAVPAAGKSPDTDGEHAAALAAHPAQGPAAQRDDADLLSLALCHQGIPAQGTLNWQLKQPLNWAVLNGGFVPHCSYPYGNRPSETLGELLCSSVIQLRTKLPWHHEPKQQPSD